ncbi:uncharacterized protein LOC129228070 [Uloborus diversus]|uniref:uncharacterized protein LOC129228070 n=1 Tax=Uloborus diversus TaxID=327109 RepID=UPI002409F974|nr:uncharacterized protein LOC129228070 [Uloborus diversus]
MNVKAWAVLFVSLLCADYVRASIAAVNEPSLALSREKRQLACEVRPVLVELLDQTLIRIKNRSPDELDLPDRRVDNYQMRGGKATGFKNVVRVEEYGCSCSGSVLRIFVEVSYLRILVSYTLSLVEELLGGLLGNLGTSLTRLLGNVVDLLLRILCLDIRVQLVIEQQLIPGARCRVASFRVLELTSIQLLGLTLRGAVINLLSDLLAPVLDLVLRLVISTQLRAIYVDEFSKLTITEDMFVCFNRSPY